MKMTRRALGAGLLAGAAGVGGCLGFVRGEEALRFEAVGAAPSEGALSATGYRHERTAVEPVVETIEVAGRNREVELENVVVECDKGVDLGPVGIVRAATFVAFATPRFEVLGRTFHPGDRVEPRRIATELSSHYDEFSIGEEVGEWDVDVFGEATTVSTFEGRTVMAATEIDVRVHFGTATNDDDLVLFLGAHPRRLGDEREHVATLAESLTAIS